MDKTENDSTLNNMITTPSPCQTWSSLDNTIKAARNKMKILALKKDSVISLVEEVICREKAAEQAEKEAKVEIAKTRLHLDMKRKEVEHAQRRLMLARDGLCAKKAHLARVTRKLQHRVSGVLKKEETLIGFLDKVHEDLENRLVSALLKKEVADEEKQKTLARDLSYEESQLEKVLEEFKIVEQELLESCKLEEDLINRGHVVYTLDEEIVDKFPEIAAPRLWSSSQK